MFLPSWCGEILLEPRGQLENPESSGPSTNVHWQEEPERFLISCILAGKETSPI